MAGEASEEVYHNGRRFRMPARFDRASATHLISLLDHAAAWRVCEGENYEPLRMSLPDGTGKAVGFTLAVDYHQTDVGPYREWGLGIWVARRGEKRPPLRYVNAASLAFGSVLADDEGVTAFFPKMVLTESLPTELGVSCYGIPKELGQVVYERSRRETQFAVTDAKGQRVIRTSVPTTCGFLARLGMGFSLIRAFGLGPVVRMMRRKELRTTLAGSARLLPKDARMEVKVDPKTEMFPWNERDCRLELGDSEWAGVLRELRFAPSLVCHIPNLAFLFSGPIDQVSAVGVEKLTPPHTAAHTAPWE